MTRHHAESNVNTLLTRNLPFDSDVRHGSHPLMIPLHCFYAKSNNKMRGQFKCDVTWLFHMHRAVCCSVMGRVRLKFYVQGPVGGRILYVGGQGGCGSCSPFLF